MEHSTTIIILVIISTILFLIFNIYFSTRVSNRVSAGGKKTVIENIFSWDPPWAFSFVTIRRLEAQSSWWYLVTVPVRIIKVFDIVSVQEWTSVLFFLLPFALLAYVVFSVYTKLF